MAFSFKLEAEDSQTAARAGRITTDHGDVMTPAFMPVGTAGSVKTLTPDELTGAGADILLANTYHLSLRPGAETVSRMGGLHRLMSWPGAILTDSGGFQVMSLSPLRKVTDHGVDFRSHLDGSRRLLTPEEAIGIQDALGTDIAMDLARLYAAMVTEKNDDWIWGAMIAHPDLIGGFNRLDSTILRACGGRVIAKEGADGLLGMAIEHPEYPEGLGVVIKIAHGWNPQATWYVARYVLGVLGFEFRYPYKLSRQKAFIVPDVIPESLRGRMETIVPWDSWDPDVDRWEFDPADLARRN